MNPQPSSFHLPNRLPGQWVEPGSNRWESGPSIFRLRLGDVSLGKARRKSTSGQVHVRSKYNKKAIADSLALDIRSDNCRRCNGKCLFGSQRLHSRILAALCGRAPMAIRASLICVLLPRTQLLAQRSPRPDVPLEDKLAAKGVGSSGWSCALCQLAPLSRDIQSSTRPHNPKYNCFKRRCWPVLSHVHSCYKKRPQTIQIRVAKCRSVLRPKTESAVRAFQFPDVPVGSPHSRG